MGVKAADCMEKALKTLQERGAQYGDSYVRHGKVMAMLFEPIFPHPMSEAEYNRFGVLNMIVSKLIRYCANFEDPHIDSIHDLGVYAFILEELDTNLMHKEVEKTLSKVTSIKTEK